jgi:hypothetical protein
VFRIAGHICRAFRSPGSHRSAERGHETEGARDYKTLFLSRFLRDRDGAIAAVSAVSLVVILGMGAFAIDMSYAYSERNLLQVTASVTARRSSANGNRLELFLAPILGLGSLDMEASAVAYFRAPTAWDVVLVQDVTGSFAEEIGDAREADQALLDCVSNNFADARMGLTAFTGTSSTMTPMLPIGRPENLSNYVEMSDAISNLNACPLYGAPSDPPMPPCSGTHVGIGIESAIDQLDNYVHTDGIVGQAIIIVGDGISQVRDDGTGQEDYKDSRYFDAEDCDPLKCKSTNLAHMANLAADEAEDKGYDIFVVYLEDENLSNAKIEAAAAFFEGLVRGAGRFHRTPNADELVELVPELCFRARDLQLVM